MNRFRTLRADEIDCRVARVTKYGAQLLLYKDARCDQNVLDETVGPMNWQRHHSRDNANCTVSIWDENKGMWVSKEDVGTESNTEKEKGLASDSFKRACFNWGIGRELYSAPDIWIRSADCEIKDDGGRFKCFDRFIVDSIQYRDDGARDICGLTICNLKTGNIVFRWTDKSARRVQPEEQKPEAKPEQKSLRESVQAVVNKIDVQSRVNALREWASQNNKSMEQVGRHIEALVRSGSVSAENFRTMSEEDFNTLLNALEANYGGEP